MSRVPEFFQPSPAIPESNLVWPYYVNTNFETPASIPPFSFPKSETAQLTESIKELTKVIEQLVSLMKKEKSDKS